MIPLEYFVEMYGWLGLFAASFISSIIILLPIDPLVLLAVVLGMPAVGVVGIAAVATTLGGFMVYLLGKAGSPFIRRKVGAARLMLYEKAVTRRGVPLIFIAAFTPIPYEPFAIAAGALRMAPIPFLASTFAGRLARFSLVGYAGKGLELAWVGEFGLAAALLVAGLISASIVIWYTMRLLRELKGAEQTPPSGGN
jgi:membrane protein YqaA with SNARE-associated domain